MKHALLLRITLACLAASSAATWADQLTLDQLPAGVRNTVNSQSASGPVKKIERLNRNGRTIYQIGFGQSGGSEKDIYLDENGLYLRGNMANRSGYATNALPEGRTNEVTLKALPDPLLKTINTETVNGPVKKIEQISYAGQTFYKVAYQQRSGIDKVVYLNPDGSYVQNSPNGGMFARARRAVQVNLADLPANVRNTINSETGNGPVKKIEQIPYNGRSVYKVAYQQSSGAEKLIYLNNDGSYVQDQPQTGVGTSASTATGSRESLSNATKVTLEQLPRAARNRVKATAGAATVEDIDKGMLNGKTVYEAAFKQNGQTVELRVDEQGNVIPDTNDQSILSGANR